ncbi:UPF0481 protein [Spatholobus suberectus]|nr:UPF0481 protein [Spatholobus suberectus]
MAGNSTKLTIRERIIRLENALVRPEPVRPKIQRVAHHLRGDTMHFDRHYSPKLMSLGPIHNGDPKLQLGEQYKQMWAAMYIHRTGEDPQTPHRNIADNMEELKELFAADPFTNNVLFSKYSDQGFTDMEEMMCWTLFVDGCALIHILGKGGYDRKYEMKVKAEQLIHVMGDVLLLGNQLPFLLLKLLWRDTDESTLVRTMEYFIAGSRWASGTEPQFLPPTHLLDLQYSMILPERPSNSQNPNGNINIATYRNIMELKVAGIELKASNTPSPRDICFSLGWLRLKLVLPHINMDCTIATKVLKLIAYEMCPDFENNYEINDYVSFLGSLIVHPDDVKALRLARILLNNLSDKEVVNIFDTISSNLVPIIDSYAHVKDQIKEHYHHKTLPTWLVLGYHTYFNNPWAIITFLATVLGLTLTFIQTLCAFY